MRQYFLIWKKNALYTLYNDLTSLPVIPHMRSLIKISNKWKRCCYTIYGTFFQLADRVPCVPISNVRKLFLLLLLLTLLAGFTFKFYQHLAAGVVIRENNKNSYERRKQLYLWQKYRARITAPHHGVLVCSKNGSNCSCLVFVLNFKESPRQIFTTWLYSFTSWEFIKVVCFIYKVVNSFARESFK